MPASKNNVTNPHTAATMGCGASSRKVPQANSAPHGQAAAAERATRTEDECNAALAAHISAILGITPTFPDVTRYVSAFRSQGCDAPTDLDVFTADELQSPPFSFKRIHLLKMTQHRANDKRNAALAAHLCSILDIEPASKDITQYVTQLRLEGFDNPSDLDHVAIANLEAHPFKFKQGHLLKIERSRQREKPKELTAPADMYMIRSQRGVRDDEQTQSIPAEDLGSSAQVIPELRKVRGLCSLCNLDVFDSQPRLKNHRTGLYQHEDCQASNSRASSSHAESRSMVRPTSTIVHTAAAAEETQAEVAANAAHANSKNRATLPPPPPQTTTHTASSLAITEAKGAAAAAAEETQAYVDAAHIKATATSAAAAAHADVGPEPPSIVMPDSTRSGTTSNYSFTTRKPLLPAVPKIKPLLPNGTHAFLSYQWDVQEQVKGIKEGLNERHVKCWMDIDGGMKSDIYDSMAEGVQGAACVICFMTQAYQDSQNCKLELKFAQQSGVPIIPVMMQEHFTAKGWLGILTSGSVWTPMYDASTVPDGIDKLIAQGQHLVPGMRGEDDVSDTMSEASGDGTSSSFDVGGWGDDMFSLTEMREELDRLREDIASSSRATSTLPRESGVSLCPLPAMVPILPRGLFVTTEMQSVLDAVLSDTSPPQIGFCGMGGIGKTTVSCWVTRNERVRTKFSMVAWITLGQTPVIDSCVDLLHQQLTGTSLPDGVSTDQKNEFLQQAFLNQSVLLILDDCWNADVVKHFNWIDHTTNSKVLISSRVRDVLEGGQIIDVVMPSKMDAVEMLLSTADMDVDALKARAEVEHIAELCKRLPLTIGVAGKLIRQLAHGSTMSEAGDWTDVVALLEEELNDPDGSMSIEESVIRASIKAIPKKSRKQCTQLFISFGLIPEDTLVPLSMLGLVYHACSDLETKDNEIGTTKTSLSRLQVRRCLKLLIDRSLVLGTVDRPQLHDVMLDYVQKQFAGETYKTAQRRMVESLRMSDRSNATPTGVYIKHCVKHHIKASHDAGWEKSKQAISWIEDNVSGIQGAFATAAASFVPADALAKDAETAEMWWQAALRWNAHGLMKISETGHNESGLSFFKLAVTASAKAVAGDASCFTQFHLDSFEFTALSIILKTWSPADLDLFGERFRVVSSTTAAQSRPVMCFSAIVSLDFFPAILGRDMQAVSDACWKLSHYVITLCDENTEAFARSTEADRAVVRPVLDSLQFGGDAIVNAPGFSWNFFNQGDTLLANYYSYSYEACHEPIVGMTSGDTHVYGAELKVLTLQFGRVGDAKRMLDDLLAAFQRISETPASAGYYHTMTMALHMVPATQHILGSPIHVQKMFAMAGITFDNAGDRLDQLTKPLQGWWRWQQCCCWHSWWAETMHLWKPHHWQSSCR